MSFSEHHFMSTNSAGSHRVVYSDWGQENDNIVICVHGLTGNGHDFDALAKDLSEHGHRVIAVDLPGRGRSDFLKNPLDYNYKQYYADLSALLAHLDVTEAASIDWIGISLGGLLGFHMAGMDGSPIKRLIINDVGPEVPKEALAFIYQVIAPEYRFENLAALEKRLRETRGLSWGPVTDAQWAQMAQHNARGLDDGALSYGYDPLIARVFETQPTGDADLWADWDAIACPVLLLWGQQSLVLTRDIIERMAARGPDFDLHVFTDCGHVPSLMAPGQIEIVRKFLKLL